MVLKIFTSVAGNIKQRIRTKAYQAEDRMSDGFSEQLGQTKDVKTVSPDC